MPEISRQVFVQTTRIFAAILLMILICDSSRAETGRPQLCVRDYGLVSTARESAGSNVMAISALPNLNGLTRAEGLRELEAAGFEYRSTTAGGYVQYRHADGSIVWIRTNGEVTRSGPKIKSKEGKSYHPRFDQFGNKINSEQHSTGEFLRPDGDATTH